MPGCYLVPLVYIKHEPREAIIDADSLPLVQGRNWHWEEKSDGHVGCVALASAYGRNTPLKRVVIGVENAGLDLRVSHANGDPLDCRRANLEVQTPAEQLYRTRKRGIISGKKYTSQYKGVSWKEERGKWIGQIKKGDLHRFLGHFDDEEDAAYAYDKAARELFGEHASLNFPGEGERAALPIAA
jgi:hypothetical protein